ncbi:DUF2612 domain-containing protein [Phyllobacterium sp. BT25]|uniref:DUF2612 domain-containing protein n=1 Tax=Phyllobacterium pellucidum TaxID=2740464 RepID=A0A849VM73_9HYPH|nr:DUF2612 domain-containing protein [Phyllobacterium pellucidum]NTS31255.1 DUF2612 domain-containing protein [Phyllobacterium pellucidum]
MSYCRTPADMAEERIDRVLTQYRESPNLLFVMRTYLKKAAEAINTICDLPSFFDIETAVGEQLTFVGKRLGWPRCHCVCSVQPVFGFSCDSGNIFENIVGFCEPNSSWDDCESQGFADLCINDDEMYRKFLKVRRYQMLSFFDLTSLAEATKVFFGPQARVLDSGNGRVVIAPGRELSAPEMALIQLYPRVIPVAAGINIRFHFGPLHVFGFGDGWGGFCEPYDAQGTLGTENGDEIGTENGDVIGTGVLTRDAEWMCEIDVKPYDCM